MANVENSNTMTYQPGEIHTGMSENTFSQREKIEGGTYRDHCIILRRTEPEIYWDRLPVSETGYLLLVYEVSFLTNM